MKKSLLFVAAILLSFAVNAQTIVIDGNNADWANVPMLSDPGATPVFKMVVPQDGLTLPDDAAICVMVERTEAEKAIIPGAPIVYVDADKNAATGGPAWYCPSFGPDYEMGAWDGNGGAASEDETINEVVIVKSNFTGIPFAGDCNAWMLFILKEDWSEYKYLPNSPSDNAWLWSENDYHPIYVKPFAFADLNGTLQASAVYSSHEALTPGDALDMGDATSSADVALWASWAVELKEPANYIIKANISSTNTASVDLKLVNLATNEIVATFASEDLAEGAEVEVGEWDLSNVPAGKYMLRFSNHVEWSAMKLNSLTLEAKSDPSGVQTVNAASKAVKVIRNGQVLFIRDGKTFNALGAEVK